MNRAQRNIWLQENPIGAPDRGAPYGERLDPASMGSGLNTGAMSSGGGWMTLAGTAMNVIGGLKAADAAEQQGADRSMALEYEATLLAQNADAARAASQREAMDVTQKTRLMISRSIAVAAASGGGASDPTVADIVADIAGAGAYRQAVALYGGEDKARALNATAAGKRYDARLAREGGADVGDAYRLKALGSGVAGAATLFSKYGNNSPGLNSMGIGSSGNTDIIPNGGYID